MEDNADAKRILSTHPPEDWRRPRGRPRITWLSTIQQDLRSHNLTLPEAMDMAQNRSLRRMWSMHGATQSLVACQKRRRQIFHKIHLFCVCSTCDMGYNLVMWQQCTNCITTVYSDRSAAAGKNTEHHTTCIQKINHF